MSKKQQQKNMVAPLYLMVVQAVRYTGGFHRTLFYGIKTEDNL